MSNWRKNRKIYISNLAVKCDTRTRHDVITDLDPKTHTDPMYVAPVHATYRGGVRGHPHFVGAIAITKWGWGSQCNYTTKPFNLL